MGRADWSLAREDLCGSRQLRILSPSRAPTAQPPIEESGKIITGDIMNGGVAVRW